MNTMKTNIQTTLLTGALLGGMLLAPLAAQAQDNVPPAAGGRLAVVDIKDASLKDALDLVFDSAGIKSRSIDASASQIYVPDVVRSNIAWDDLVRSLCLTYNYKFSRNRDGLYVIEPRIPIGLNPDGSSSGFPGQEGFPGQSGFQGQGGFPGQSGFQSQGGFSGRGTTSAPANPFGFGGAPQGNTRNFSNRQMLPEVQTLANSQTIPRAGGRNGGRANNNGTPAEPLKYTIIKVKHVYSGGIAALFADSSTITTDIFVTPGQTNNNNNNGGGNGNNGGNNSFGGGSSFGGGGSSFGGGGGSFGGGGGSFGGGGGSFGGGGFGGGGF